MSFATLKKSANSFDKLTKEIEKLNKPQGAVGPDERLWKPGVDKSGNGYAVIRFLPECDGEDLPWAQVWSHAFQGPGGWYIENSLTTLNQKDPVGELNRTLWNSGIESDKEIARKQKRKLSYYSNIYVVKDQLNPANEGKVFLYKYGKKIHDKIASAMQPQFEDDVAINPFDMWKGADFRVKIQTIGGYWNYDKSDFGQVSTLGGLQDDGLEEVWKSQYSLTEFSGPTNFKSYEELETRLNSVLSVKKTRVETRNLNEEEDEELYGAGNSVVTVPSGFGNRVEEYSTSSTELDYFASLAAED